MRILKLEEVSIFRCTHTEFFICQSPTNILFPYKTNFPKIGNNKTKIGYTIPWANLISTIDQGNCKKSSDTDKKSGAVSGFISTPYSSVCRRVSAKFT